MNGAPDALAMCHDGVLEGADRTRRSIRGGTTAMKFALHFGNIAFSDPEGARRLVRLAEAAGFDSVFAVEHVVFPDNYTSVYPYAPGGRLPGGPSVKFPDPLLGRPWVAAATQPAGAGQGGRHARLSQRRPDRTGNRGGLAKRGVRGARYSFRASRQAR